MFTLSTYNLVKVMRSKEQPRRRAYHHGDLRNALIEAGLAIVGEHGLDGLNLRAVAARVNVSHAAPYRHFTDKQALVAAIAEAGFQLLAKHLHTALEAGPQSPSEAIMIVGQTYIAFALEQRDYFRLMFSKNVGDRRAHPSLYMASKAVFNIVLETIVSGQEQQVFSKGEAVQFAESTWAMMHGLATLLVEDQFAVSPSPTTTREDVIEFVRVHLQPFLVGLTGTGR
jgi:AcrR family transcriptional regulator